jgi:hypothetical protein
MMNRALRRKYCRARREGALRRRYGRSSGSSFRWSPPQNGAQRLLDVPYSNGEVIVMAYPHFAEVSVVPARGQTSAEMSFSTPADARRWGEVQAKRFGLLEVQS